MMYAARADDHLIQGSLKRHTPRAYHGSSPRVLTISRTFIQTRAMTRQGRECESKQERKIKKPRVQRTAPFSRRWWLVLVVVRQSKVKKNARFEGSFCVKRVSRLLRIRLCVHYTATALFVLSLFHPCTARRGGRRYMIKLIFTAFRVLSLFFCKLLFVLRVQFTRPTTTTIFFFCRYSFEILPSSFRPFFHTRYTAVAVLIFLRFICRPFCASFGCTRRRKLLFVGSTEIFFYWESIVKVQFFLFFHIYIPYGIIGFYCFRLLNNWYDNNWIFVNLLEPLFKPPWKQWITIKKLKYWTVTSKLVKQHFTFSRKLMKNK